VKKLPIIGLIVGAIAAGLALMKRKKSEPEPGYEANPNPSDTGTTGNA
jgi:hypothetical protein